MSTEGTAASLSRRRPSYRSAGALWIGMVVLVAALAVASAISVPERYAQLTMACPVVICRSGQVGPADLQVLRSLGIPIGVYESYLTALEALVALGSSSSRA